MTFDISIFESQLEQFKSEPIKVNKDKGVSIVIEHIWMHSSTSEIDFDSFSLDDIEVAFDEMNSLPLHFDEGGEVFTCNHNNLFMILDVLSDICYKMTNFTNKRFVFEEDDLFL